MDKNITGIEPYTDYLYIKPIERKQTMVRQKATLFEVAEVIAIGPEVKNTKVGDLVSYEHWDMPDVEGMDSKTYCFLKERDAICKFKVSEQLAS